MTNPSPRVTGASIPPLRSMSIKRIPHHNSTANLSPSSLLDFPERHVETGPPSTTPPISKTIHNLEVLLREALQIARSAAEDPVDQDADPQHPVSKQTSPSQGTQSQASAFVESFRGTEKPSAPVSRPKTYPRVSFLQTGNRDHDNANQKHSYAEDAMRACGAAHNEILRVKAALDPPIITVTDQDWEEQPLSNRHQSLPILSELGEPMEPPHAALSPEYPQRALSRRSGSIAGLLSKKDIKKHIKTHDTPPILPRITSRKPSLNDKSFARKGDHLQSACAIAQTEGQNSLARRNNQKGRSLHPLDVRHEGHFSQIFGMASKQVSIDLGHLSRSATHKIDLNGNRHVDINNDIEAFDLHESCNHQPVARDWPNSRKRFAATVACINTACMGIIIGIYAGEVPAIQYVIVDFHHYTILGNVFLYLGLVVPTLCLWPLPLLHGRKPYVVTALLVALCLQIPQGLAVSTYRSPYVRTYRVLLLFSRAVCGFALGFANINLQSALLDLFGASLQSGNPHQEVVDQYDVRRHGGGMGLWLGIWSWCTIGSISIGFLIGALIISATDVTWGFWTCLLLLMFVLLLNMVSPELRRSAFRRTVAEVIGENANFSRVARGEVKMHLKNTGPYWWGEEVKAGLEMSWLMLKQPGFLVLAIYTAWVYAQFTMILMMIGALASRYYVLRPEYVGLCALSLGGGALLATPFQKASLFSRARHHPQRTDSMTFQRRVVWSSHLARRGMFTTLLPLSALAYTLTSGGPPMPLAVPCVFAAIVGFLSNLAIAECYGLIMETFDTSDLQPGMTGRPARLSVAARLRPLRTNFSCYPRVSAGFAITQSLEFIFGAVATGICGRVERRMGTLRATAIIAGTLLSLTILLTAVIWRCKTVKMIPKLSTPDTPRKRRDTDWEPVVLGTPSGTDRKISILEAGRQSRWSEIRRRNRINTGLA